MSCLMSSLSTRSATSRLPAAPRAARMFSDAHTHAGWRHARFPLPGRDAACTLWCLLAAWVAGRLCAKLWSPVRITDEMRPEHARSLHARNWV